MMSVSIAIFVVSIAGIVYVIGGYPLLLAWLARRHSRPVLKDNVIRDISIVIAAHNGEQFVEAKLRSVLALNYPREHMQIIFVSDGSTDRTDEIAQSFRNHGVEFYRIEKSGKAGAVNCGISYATGEILVLNDVRQTLDPESVRNVVACFADPRVGAVSGKLHIRTGQISEEADTGLYWKYEVFIRKQMSRIDSTFGTSGHFYALRRTLAVPIPQDTLLDDVYLPLSAFFRGYRIVLEETAKTFDYPTNLNSEFKRKVRTQAGLYQILREYPQLLSSSNRMRIHFLSAKFARLLLPFLLILILLSSFGLPDPFKEIAIAVQVIFYGIAFLDRWIPEDRLIKSISSPIRTFVVLMAASLMACKIFFIPARDLWKETKVRVG
jgi:cellulose synthase/poly-beta-1,6-N-acetylglucosamine synthase-like glycosyltransferase